MKPKYKTKFKSNRSADLILKRAKMLKRKRLSTARKKKFKSRNRIDTRKKSNMLPNNYRSIKQSKNANSSINWSNQKPLSINEDTDDDCICLENSMEKIVIIEDDHSSNRFLPSSNWTSFRKKSVTNDNNSNLNLKTSPNLNNNQQAKELANIKEESSISLSKNCEPSVSKSKLDTSLPKNASNNNNNNKDDGVCILDDTVEEADGDDSVIFIAETYLNNELKCLDTTVESEEKKLSIVPDNKIENLFTDKELIEISKYNSNTYNPTRLKITSKKRAVLIDGSNVAFSHSLNKHFSVKGLHIALEYFEKMGHDVKAVVPMFRLNYSKSSNPQKLKELHGLGKIVLTPCKWIHGRGIESYDDRFTLQLAFEMDAAIVSNDNYRDLIHENPAFKKIIESRVISYSWCNDIFILPKDPYGKHGPALEAILNRC